MAVEELLLYFLLIPAGVYGAAAAVMRWGMRRGAEERVGLLRERGATGKFLVYTTLQTTHLLFGAILFLQFQIAAPQGLGETVTRSFGQTWATAVALTGLSQAWTVASRGVAAYEGETFARVLILAVLPETVVVFNLVVGIQMVAALAYPVTPEVAEGLTRACLYMMAGSVAAPLEAAIFTRTKDLRERGLSQALLRGVVAEFVVVIALVFALQELARVL